MGSRGEAGKRVGQDNKGASLRLRVYFHLRTGGDIKNSQEKCVLVGEWFLC